MSPATTAIDVCCRDPNYKDPWPDMNGGNAFGGQGGDAGVGPAQTDDQENNAGLVPRVDPGQKPARRPSYGK